MTAGAAAGTSLAAGSFGVASLRRTFGSTVALNGVDLTVAAGEVHALLGGNGSGKSTLVKILSGVQPADAGHIIVGDEVHRASDWSPQRARAAHVHVVHQDGAVFPDLTVAENLAMGRGFDCTGYGRIRWQQSFRRAQLVLDRFHIAVDPRTPMSSLGPADAMGVAISRALQDQENSHDGLLILDEPTAALSNSDTDLLLGVLRRYAASGQAILYISHRLDEVLRFADRLTVLRDGQVVASRTTQSLTAEDLVELIVGRRVSMKTRATMERRATEPLLEVTGLSGGPVRDVSFAVGRGEVVGIAGSLGSGRSHLLKLLFGVFPRSSGDMRLAGVQVRPRSPRSAMTSGLALIPEDRGSHASFSDLCVRENLSAASITAYWQRGWVGRRAEQRDARRALRDYGIVAASPGVGMATLSGGNQQKVVLGRWLRRQPRLMLLDEPTQGVDAGAREQLYALIHAAVDDGAGALIVASDFEELARVCDRVLIMVRGRMVGELTGPKLTAQALTEWTFEFGRPAEEGNAHVG